MMGAVNPVSGSSVTLWEAGNSGYGTGATELGTDTSAGDGSFGHCADLSLGERPDLSYRAGWRRGARAATAA